MVDKQMQEGGNKSGDGKLIGLRAMQLFFLSVKISETDKKASFAMTTKKKMAEVEARRRINGVCWRPLDAYDKVMKGRRMVPSSARSGSARLTNTLHAG